ncbi:MAG: hypothetical protein IT380_29030 [Myxococcales bacterium]|nr:hypothetical protein [Myxococcales bacterium]
MLLALCAAVLAASPESAASPPASVVQSGASPSSSHGRFAFTVSLASVPLSTPTFGVVGLGGLGGVAGVGESAAPRGGLFAEVRLTERWSFELGVEASYGASGFGASLQQLQLTASPGVRWYARAAFDGPFLALQLPVSWARSSVSFSTADGTTSTLSSTAWVAGGALLVGWCFGWDNGLLVSVAAGPTAMARRNELPGLGSASGTVGLRTQVALGVRF